MSCVYILQCQENKWYVGKTDNLQKRYKEHCRGYGAKFTQKYKPLKIHQIINTNSKREQDIFEMETTLEYMLKYNWQNVAGWKWCQSGNKLIPFSIKDIYDRLFLDYDYPYTNIEQLL